MLHCDVRDDDHLQTMNIEEQQMVVKLIERLEEIPLNSSRLDRTTRINTLTSPMVHLALVTFLKENQDVFAKSHEDMPGINPSIMVHRLNVSPSFPPIRQKKRVFAQERDQAITEESRQVIRGKLHQGSILSRLASKCGNSQKSQQKSRQVTNLDKACPKDSYPLPQVDVLVDSTAQHQLLSFMDAFSGYNQIQMDEVDQEKTSFVTSQGILCYKVMSFSLKNAGTMYQRFMNKMFANQIKRHVQVYVDDMLVKSRREETIWKISRKHSTTFNLTT